MLVVSAVVILLIILFIWEPIRPDIISLSIPVILYILKPWTLIEPTEALSGFANKATLTVLAMFILSRGIQRSGIMHLLGNKIAEIAGKEELRQLSITSTIAGLIAGFLNNTPVVAIFIPMVKDLARKTKISPSKLLLPLSYAAMMGGMLTLIGTSTNLLASDLSARLLNRPFSIFEFTKLGIIIYLIGIIYLLTAGRKLVPERINPAEDVLEEYSMGEYLTEVVICDDSQLIDKELDYIKKTNLDFELVQVIRNGDIIDLEKVYKLNAGDHLIVRADKETLFKIIKREGLRLLPEIKIDQKYIELEGSNQKVMEAIVPHGSDFLGTTFKDLNYMANYNAAALAIRKGGKLTHSSMEEISLQAGDVMLLVVSDKTLKRLQRDPNLLVIGEISHEEIKPKDIILATGILLSVILSAVLGLMPISLAAFGGVVLMVLTGCLGLDDIYKSVNWEVIFLLAGLIPLGIALEKTGTATFIANQLVVAADYFSPIVILGLFFFITALLTNIISNNASVVLMIPVAIDAATKMGANPFAFVLSVTFAASTAFLTPVGYQTNLMVYGPGGYKFRDYIIAGAPLQIIVGIVVTVGISLFWGL